MGAAGAGAAFAGIGAALSTTAIGGLLLSTGAGLILSGAGSLFVKKPKVSAASTERLKASFDLNAYRTMLFGTTALATDLRYEEWNGSAQDICDRVYILASHAITSLDEIWIDTKLAWTASGGTQGDYVGYFFCDYRLNPGSGGGFDVEQGRWTHATAPLTGCASAHLRFKVTGLTKTAESPFSSSIPDRLTFRGKGMPLYDPRFDSSAGGSGSMRANDQTTWAFTQSGVEIGRNLPLQMLARLLGWRINGRLAIGSGLPADRIDMDSFITAANLADEAVVKADGSSEPRYRGDGAFNEGDDPKTVIATFEGSMNGKLRDRNGKLALQLFHNDLATPVLDFTADDVLGEFTWSPGQSLESKKNIIRGRYTDPSDASLYQLVDYPAVTLTSVDGIDRIDAVDYALVQSPSQAQRLAKQRLQRNQYPGSFSASFNAKGWALSDGDMVRLTFPALGFANKLFRVDQSFVDPTGVVPMVLLEEYALIYAWDADERPAVIAAAPGLYDPLLNPLVQALNGVDDQITAALATATVPNADFATTADAVGTYDAAALDMIAAQLAVLNSEYAATATILNGANTTVTGTGPYTVTKSGGTNGVWDAGAVSDAGYIGNAVARIEATSATLVVVAGLSIAPNTDAGYASINRAIYLADAGGGHAVIVLESGTTVGSYGTWTAGDVFWVVQGPDGGISYWRGATLDTATLLTATAGTLAQLWFDSSVAYSTSAFKAAFYQRR